MGGSITIFFHREQEDLIMLDCLASDIVASRKYLKDLKKTIDKSIAILDRFNFDEKKLQSIFSNYCENLEKSRALRESQVIQPKARAKNDLYLIKNTVTNNYKIGYSNNPKNRLKQLNLSSDQKLIIVYSLKDLGHLERDTHKLFNHLRLNSEWFKNDNSILEYFENLNK